MPVVEWRDGVPLEAAIEEVRSIQAPRPSRARVATGAAALVPRRLRSRAYPRARRERSGLLSLVLGGSRSLAGGSGSPVAGRAPVARGSRSSAPSTRFCSSRGAGRPLDEWTPLYAAGFLFVAELAFWSIEPRVPAWSELEVVLAATRNGRWLPVVGAAGLAAVVIIAAGASSSATASSLEAAGLAAAVVALALLGALVATLALTAFLDNPP